MIFNDGRFRRPIRRQQLGKQRPSRLVRRRLRDKLNRDRWPRMLGIRGQLGLMKDSS